MFSSLKRWFDSVKVHRIPQGSFVFDQLVPALLVVLGLITVLGIIYAICVLVGVVHLS